MRNKSQIVLGLYMLEQVRFKDDEPARTVNKLSRDGELADQDEALNANLSVCIFQ